MTSRCTNEGGFTLIEMLMAVMIFGVGILGIMSMQLTSIQTNSRADTMMVTASLAASALEETLARAEKDPIFDGSEGDLPRISVMGVGPMTIHRKITVVIAPPTVRDPGLARVDIVVTDANGRTVNVCGYKRFL